MLGLRWVPRPHHGRGAGPWPRISRATAYRYLDEIIIVLAEQAPDLREALKRAKDEGFSHVILDSKVIACHRRKEPAVSVKGRGHWPVILRQGA